MTEADEFFEKTAMNAADPTVAPVAESVDLVLSEDLDQTADEDPFLNDVYSDAAPIFAPFTKEEAISRLKQAEEQFRSGQWHTMEEVLAKVRRSICSYGN